MLHFAKLHSGMRGLKFVLERKVRETLNHGALSYQQFQSLFSIMSQLSHPAPVISAIITGTNKQSARGPFIGDSSLNRAHHSNNVVFATGKGKFCS